MFKEFTPYSIGQLFAIYEHRTVVEGFLWGVNSFDQFGVQLGKNLAKNLRKVLNAENREEAVGKYVAEHPHSENLMNFFIE